MLDIILEKVKQILKSRLFPITIIYLVLFIILINRLFYLQIVTGEKSAADYEYKITKTRDIKSTRANIYDRYGKLLAYNILSYSVTFEDTGALLKNADKNAMIYKMIQVVEQNGDTISTTLPIELNNSGELVFSKKGSTIERFKKDIYSASSSGLTKEQEKATAKEVFEYLRTDVSSKSPKFEISSNYTKEEALKIMSVRYSMFLTQYTKYIPIIVATDVSDVTVAAIKENKALLPGVDILQDTHREYNDSIYLSNIIGYTGPITPEELDSLKAENKVDSYSKTDQIGKMGIEKVYEEYLHGVKGLEKISVNDANGRVVGVLGRVEPTAGNDVYLTIDSELQKACYQLLEKQIAGVLLANIHSGTSTGTKGTSAADIKIPIFDVYFALINNNIIDITTLNKSDSTNLEKETYNKFLSVQKSIYKQLDTILAVNSKSVNSSVSDDLEDYLNYIYLALKTDGILIKESIDTKDNMYLNYKNNKISLSEFLQYAISKNWVDLTKLEVGDKYFSSEELYKKLITYTKKILSTDTTFNKKLYNTLVYSQKLSGLEICLLLFDQGVLKYDKDTINSLKSGAVSPYNFMRTQIKSLQITPAQLALEPCSGSIVVTDVNNGDVLALVSYPSYDNNMLANTMDSDYYNQVTQSLSLPMFNRATQQRTAPGSTYKMLVSVAGVEENAITTTEKIQDEVIFDKTNPPAKCWIYSHGRSHGEVDVANALEVSCNYFFYTVGYRLSLDSSKEYNSNLGLKKLAKYAAMFGFDDKSGIELPEYIPQISDKTSVRSAIGQGTNNFTPSQLSKYVTTIANGGTCYNLTILDKIKDNNGNTLVENNATIYNKVSIADSTWSAVKEGMHMVVNGSDSTITHLFKDSGAVIAGKTGTAQESTSKPNHALFVSYAPFDKPEISVTSVIPNGYASSNAAELTGNVYNYYFNKEGRTALLNKEVALPATAAAGD